MNYIMQNIKYILSSLVLLIAMSSCENLLTKELDIEDDFSYEDQLAISGFLNVSSNYSNLNLLVTKNQSIIQTSQDIQVLDDVTATLYKGENVVSTLINTELNGEQSPYYYHSDSLGMSTSGEYTIKVEHPELGTATATTIVPDSVEVISAIFDTISPTNNTFFDTPDANVELTIKDTEGNNYYNAQLSIHYTYKYVDGQGDTIRNSTKGIINMQSRLPDFINLDDGTVVFSDQTFDESEITLNFDAFGTRYLIEDSFYELDSISLTLLGLSEDAYRFKKSYKAYIDAQDFELFSEPVSLYNNVEGGLGYLGGIYQQSINVEFEE